MDTFIVQFTDNIIKLKDMFGWWALALIGATFLIMIPINYALKKLFGLGKENVIKNRIRKVLASALVFPVAGGLIVAFLAFINKTVIAFNVVYQGAIPCAVAAMLLNSIYKFIRDTGIEGIKQIFTAIANSNVFKTAANKLIPDKHISSLIQNYISEQTKDIDTSNLSDFLKHNTSLIDNVATKVSGFVDNPKQTAIDVLTAFVSAQKCNATNDEKKTA